jgi:hypothetical protein
VRKEKDKRQKTKKESHRRPEKATEGKIRQQQKIKLQKTTKGSRQEKHEADNRTEVTEQKAIEGNDKKTEWI